MNLRRYVYILLPAILVAGLFAGMTDAIAGPLKVESADPKSGLLGETHIVTIKGQGFSQAKSVRFLVNKSGNDTGNVQVTLDCEPTENCGVVDDSTIRAKASIGNNATVALYDIEVELYSGRKGKGTTLFSVRSKDQTIACAAAFDLADGTTCDCEFTVSDSVDSILNIVGDCSTNGTLFLDSYRFNGTGIDATITASSGFVGRAVVAATSSDATFRDMQINLAAGIDAGCGGDNQLNSFISYRLDAGSDMSAPYSHMLAWNNRLTSSGPVVCHGIEAVREAGTGDTPEFKVAIEGNVIADGTYEKTGILFQGFGPMIDNAGARLSVSLNTIGNADDTNPAAANAIQFGPIVGPGGEVTDNVINTNTGTGILIVGDPAETDSETLVGHNTVQGATVAILVDDNITSAVITSNTLIGDGNRSVFDVGVCTDAGSNRTRPNKISGFDESILEQPTQIDGLSASCTDLAQPW